MDTSRMRRGTAEHIATAKKLSRQGLTTAQVAEQMGYSAGSVERWLHYETYQKRANKERAHINYRQRQRRRGEPLQMTNLRTRVRLYVDEMLGGEA